MTDEQSGQAGGRVGGTVHEDVARLGLGAFRVRRLRDLTFKAFAADRWVQNASGADLRLQIWRQLEHS